MTLNATQAKNSRSFAEQSVFVSSIPSSMEEPSPCKPNPDHRSGSEFCSNHTSLIYSLYKTIEKYFFATKKGKTFTAPKVFMDNLHTGQDMGCVST